MPFATSVSAFMQMQKNKEKTKKEVEKSYRRRPRDLYKNKQPTQKVVSKPFNFLEYAKNNPGFLK